MVLAVGMLEGQSISSNSSVANPDSGKLDIGKGELKVIGTVPCETNKDILCITDDAIWLGKPHLSLNPQSKCLISSYMH